MGGSARMGSLAAKMCLGYGVCRARKSAARNPHTENNMHDAGHARTNKKISRLGRQRRNNARAGVRIIRARVYAGKDGSN